MAELHYSVRVSDLGVTYPSSEEMVDGDIFATLEVKPPLKRIGPEFGRVVLGRNAQAIDFNEVLSNDSATYFLVRDFAHEQPINSRIMRFGALAARIAEVASYPDSASLYMFKEVFSLQLADTVNSAA